MESEFEKLLLRQLANVRNEPLHTYFSYLYGEIAKELNLDDSLLEVGAGAGPSSIFLRNYNILDTFSYFIQHILLSIV